MKLFTKPGCQKCDYIKKEFNLEDLGVEILDIETVEGLALLAWYELVRTAEKELPILLITDNHEKEIDRKTGAIPIKQTLNWLKGRLERINRPAKDIFEEEHLPEVAHD